MHREGLSGCASVAALAAFLGFVAACDRLAMREQPSVQPYEPNATFEHHQSARPLPEGTVARGHGPEQLGAGEAADHASGRLQPSGESWEAGAAGRYPLEVDLEFVERGREEYETFCEPCHGAVGRGAGIVVRRGMVQPPSYHTARLREESPSYYYDVMTGGFGRMFSYASRVPPRDRWAIAAYIEALQLSQHAPIDRLEARDRRRLERGQP